MPLLNGDVHELWVYVRHMADLCGLRDWTVQTLVKSPEDMDELAGSCMVWYLRKSAQISLERGWEEWTPERLREVVCHELLHCHIEQITTHVRHLRGRLSTEAAELANETYSGAMEHAVDGIATAWAVSLPLPVKGAD